MRETKHLFGIQKRPGSHWKNSRYLNVGEDNFVLDLVVSFSIL